MSFVSPTSMTHLMRIRRIDEETENVKLSYKRFNARKRHKRCRNRSRNTSLNTDKNCKKETDFINFETVFLKNEILEQIKSLLVVENNKDCNCISLYDVSKLLTTFNNQYDEIKRIYKKIFNYILNLKFKDLVSLIDLEFDYKNNELCIKFKYNTSNYEMIHFSKKNGALYVVKSESLYANDILKALYTHLSNFYDVLMKFSGYKNYFNGSYNIKSVNSEFDVNINSYGVSIYIISANNYFNKNFELFSPSYANEYLCKCSLGTITSEIRGIESKLFKKIFVKISDCPVWSQVTLYEIRKNQLIENQEIDNNSKCLKHKNI